MTLWADARVYLGIQEDELWSFTFVELNKLFDTFKRKQALEDYRFGKVCEIVAASQGAKTNNGKPLTPAYFFPSVTSLTNDPYQSDSNEMTPEQMWRWAQQFALIQGTAPQGK